MQLIALLNRCLRFCKPTIKIVRAMQLTTVLLLGLCLQLSAKGISQTITFSGKNVPLERVFSVIKSQTGYFVSYKASQLKNSNPITVYSKDVPITQFLNFVLQNQPLTFSIKKTTIFIRWKPAPVISVSKNNDQRSKDLPVKVQGRVVDENGNGVLASVIVKGTNKGSTTNTSGYFELELGDNEENPVLVISGIGVEEMEFQLEGKTNVLIRVTTKITAQEEIVITSLGIEKQKNSITYATQHIGGDEVIKAKDPNFVNELSGKVAGAMITKGNFGPGSATRVLLRGDKSFTGNSEPLYVLNGIPMFGKSDLLVSINPEDIESIQVMKGASASALYGSQAANGVLFITTKKGKRKGYQVNLASQATLENAMDLPKLQTSYGRTIPTQNDSWGEKISNGSDSHLKKFFKTGLTLINSISLSSGNEQAQVYLSYANTDAKGIIPKNNLLRNNFTIRGTTQLLNQKLKIDASLNYTTQKITGQNEPGGFGSSLPGIYSFPVDDDFSQYDKNHFEVWDEVRLLNRQNWPYIRNETFPNQNPFWFQYRNQRESIRDHAITSLNTSYKINNWIDLQARGLYDKIDNKFEARDYATTQITVAGVNGGYGVSLGNTRYLYSDLLFLANKNIGDKFSLEATIGFSQASITEYELSASSTVGASLAFPNYFSIYALNTPFDKSESLRRYQNTALFGNLTLSFLNKLYLDVTSRTEWSSTVSQSYSYPSVGLSYAMIENSTKKNFGISYLKIRGSFAQVGNSLPFGIKEWDPPYSLSNTGNIVARTALPFFDGTDTINLKPERTSSLEFGIDSRMLKDKLSFGLTYYRATSFDQVFQIQAPAGAGVPNFWINGGVIRNVGIEGTINYRIIDNGFKWNTAINFSQNRNIIKELSQLLNADYYVLGGSYLTASLFLTRPKDGKFGSYGDLFGRVYERDKNGNIVFGDDGLPKITSTFDHYIGNANPKFLAGFNNSFGYKNISLSFLITSRFGGEIYNRTEQWLDYKGLSKRTGDARNRGAVIFEGKKIDTKLFYMNQTGAGAGGATEGNLYDVTNVRLRELSIGYDFKQVRACKINLSLVGRNLFFFYKKAPFDPEILASTSQTVEGIASFTMPSTRTFGLNLKVTF